MLTPITQTMSNRDLQNPFSVQSLNWLLNRVQAFNHDGFVYIHTQEIKDEVIASATSAYECPEGFNKITTAQWLAHCLVASANDPQIFDDEPDLLAFAKCPRVLQRISNSQRDALVRVFGTGEPELVRELRDLLTDHSRMPVHISREGNRRRKCSQGHCK